MAARLAPSGVRRVRRVRRARRAWRASRGFTLVEVLVALVVMSIIAGLSWQAVDGMARSRDAVQASMDRTLSHGTTLAQWEQDLQSLLVDAPVPAIHFDGVRLRLVRSTPQGAQLVVWSLQQGLWQRWASAPMVQDPALSHQWAAAASMQGREPGQVTLARNVEGWQLYFFRGNAWSNAQSTGDLLTTGVAAAMAAQGQRGSPPAADAAGAGAGTATGAGAGAGSAGPMGAAGASTGQPTAPAAARERPPQGVRLVLALGPGGGGSLTRDVLVPGGQP